MPGEYEVCAICGERTGRAGKGEDSLFFEDIGPLCPECFEEVEQGAKQ